MPSLGLPRDDHGYVSVWGAEISVPVQGLLLDDYSITEQQRPDNNVAVAHTGSIMLWIHSLRIEYPSFIPSEMMEALGYRLSGDNRKAHL